MRVLVYSLYEQGYQEACQLEAAKKYMNDGHEVIFVMCGSSLCSCNINILSNKAKCSLCQILQRRHAIKFLGKSQNILSVNDYVKDVEEERYESIFSYKSIDDLKKIKFEEIEIGYGALSSYIGWTRNMAPNFSSHRVRFIFDYLLKLQIKLTLAIKQIVKDFKPDLIVVHNGRFAHCKPLIGVAKSLHIDYLCTEALPIYNQLIYKNNFINDIPHSLYANTKKYNEFWDAYPDVEERAKFGKMFFENRRHAKFAGDKIYAGSQITGKLPNNWESTKENIVIFNSSEDEFCAINQDTEKAALFKDQIQGIKAIAEHYQSDGSKHFYLRVHPNLKNVPYQYHLDLYKLDYSNLTVIPARSDISSYSLLDHADKVIVFGSTMGIEGAYWGKPVINLAFALYALLDVVYLPQTKDDLWELIDNKELKVKNRNNALKYGSFYMSDKHEGFEFFKMRQKIYNLFGRQIIGYGYLGSKRLYVYMNCIFNAIEKRMPILCKFKGLT